MEYFKTFLNGQDGMILKLDNATKTFWLYAPCTAPVNDGEKISRSAMLKKCKELKNAGWEYWTNTGHEEFIDAWRIW